MKTEDLSSPGVNAREIGKVFLRCDYHKLNCYLDGSVQLDPNVR